jgi:hypothetical protein
VVLQVLLFPSKSVTVSVTAFAPMFAQVNTVMLGVNEAIPQASEDPLLMSAPVMVALPDAFSWTVMFWQTATGSMVSCTVTVLLQDEELPFTSVTVNATGLAPMLAQVNAVVLGVSVAIPQASEEPLFSIAPVIVALPLALS